MGLSNGSGELLPGFVALHYHTGHHDLVVVDVLRDDGFDEVAMRVQPDEVGHSDPVLVQEISDTEVALFVGTDERTHAVGVERVLGVKHGEQFSSDDLPRCLAGVAFPKVVMLPEELRQIAAREAEQSDQ